MTDTPANNPLPRPRIPRVLVWTGVLLKYVLGVAAWLVALGALAIYTRVNVWSWVDGLWMQELHGGLVRNAIGEVAYRAEYGYGDYGSGPKYIYTLEYQLPDNQTPGGAARKEIRTLTSMVDVESWREVGSGDARLTIYVDAKHTYVVRGPTSDGTDISAVDR